MTFSELRNLVGTELEARLTALEMPGLGLYYDDVPSNYERLYVRFWFPFTGAYSKSYDHEGIIDRPLLQVDVRHFPPIGSTRTPPPGPSELVWEALKMNSLAGVSGTLRQPDSRVPLKDSSDHSRWGWHRYMLFVS